jgi:hypothetical protein
MANTTMSDADFRFTADQLVTFAEAARLVGPGVTARTLRTWHEKGLLRSIRVGRAWRTRPSWVEESIQMQAEIWNLKWQGSSSADQTTSTEPTPSHACGGMSGTSNGVRGAGAASVAQATNLASGLLRNKNSAGTSLPVDGRRPAPVIPLK